MKPLDARRIALILISVGTLVSVTRGQDRTRDFTPITDETLKNPDPGDWINWRRTLDGWGYSPLNAIDRSNVGQLQLAWSRSMGARGSNVTVPLVYRGLMYLSTPDGVLALDATNGDFLWEYKREVAARRNIAMYDDKIYLNTADGHIIALNARNGSVVWDTAVNDPAKKGFGFSSGAIIVNGKVISGMFQCGRVAEDTCYITAHDAKTGKEVWRTSTVARPGEPGGDTWGGVPLKLRTGGEPWRTGSYDSRSNLIFWGTAQAKPWASAQRGFAGAALYTASTLALNPETGKMVWYFQHVPDESHDEDEVYESVLVDDGGRRSLFKMGKLGVLWELDVTTGKFVSAHDLGYQDLINIDPKTGAATYRPGKVQKLGVPVDYCPGPGGFKNFWAMSYHPDTHAFYIPLNLTCTRAVYDEVPPRTDGSPEAEMAKRPTLYHPASPGQLGEFAAMDSRTGKVLWRHRQTLPYNSAALTTAGGLAFVGGWEGYFEAFDVTSGASLWQTRLPASAHGYPIAYRVNNRQYIAITSGPGSSWSGINIRDLHLNVHQNPGGMGVHVFALPQEKQRR